MRRSHGNEDFRAHSENGPKPNGQSNDENPEPKPKTACSYAALHENIIAPTSQVDQENRSWHNISISLTDPVHGEQTAQACDIA
jgi:hypothetical protein